MLFTFASGTRPPQSSLRSRGARLHPTLPRERQPRERVRHHTAASWPNRPTLFRLRGPGRNLSPRVPTTHSHPRSRGQLHHLAAASPTDRVCLSRFITRRGFASHVSCRFVHGHPPFRGFSPPVAAGPSRAQLSSMPFPTLRCRGSEDLSFRRMRSPEPALFTPTMGRSSPGRFPPSRMTSRSRPALLQDSSHGLLSCSRARPSPRGCPLGSFQAPVHVRSSEFQRTGSLPGVTGLPPWGPCRCVHPSCRSARDVIDSPWTRPTSPPG